MAHVVIAITGSVVVLVITLLAKVPTYRVAPLALLPLMWAPYWLRRRIHLHPAHYAMFVVALILHDLGAIGFYQRSPLPPISWDIIVHTYFAFAVAFALHRLLERSEMNLRPWQACVATVLFIMGCGALHEIMEYGSYLVLGEERGMLKPKTSYFFDTQRDLTGNLAGVLLALMMIGGFRLLGRINLVARGRFNSEAEPSRAG